jgi:hypothetical protein
MDYNSIFHEKEILTYSIQVYKCSTDIKDIPRFHKREVLAVVQDMEKNIIDTDDTNFIHREACRVLNIDNNIPPSFFEKKSAILDVITKKLKEFIEEINKTDGIYDICKKKKIPELRSILRAYKVTNAGNLNKADAIKIIESKIQSNANNNNNSDNDDSEDDSDEDVINT